MSDVRRRSQAGPRSRPWRDRRRLSRDRRRPWLMAAVAALCAALGAVPAASAAADPPATHVLQYLLRAEAGNGGFPLSPGQAVSPMATGWTAVAIGAARAAGLISSTSDAGEAVITFLEQDVRQQTDPGSIEREVLALRALGQPVSDVDGVPLLHRLQALISAGGSVDGQTNLTSWAILALKAAGAALPPASVGWLERQQDGDGGFNFDTGGRTAQSDPDDTGAALEALAAAGADRTRSGALTATVTRAIGYLRRDQNRDGGFGSPLGADSNAQSTAWAEQGLIAVGVSPSAVRRDGGRDPQQYLQAMVAGNGSVNYAQGTVQTPIWTSAEALPALLGRALPIELSTPAHGSGGSQGGGGGQAPNPSAPLAGRGSSGSGGGVDIGPPIGRLIAAVHL